MVVMSLGDEWAHGNTGSSKARQLRSVVPAVVLRTPRRGRNLERPAFRRLELGPTLRPTCAVFVRSTAQVRLIEPHTGYRPSGMDLEP